MRKLGLFLLAFAAAAALFGAPQVAHAGETYLGTLYVYDGGTTNNCETTVRDAGREWDGGIISDGGATDLMYHREGFAIGTGRLITIQCRNDVLVLPNVRGCDAGRCPRLYAEQWLTSSTGAAVSFPFTYYTGFLFLDGGLATANATCNDGIVAVTPQSGATAICDVYGRSGNE